MAKKENSTDFVNPYQAATYEQIEGVNKLIPGPSIADFISALNGASVADYVKNQIKETSTGELKEFDESDVAYLESEIKKYEYNTKNKDKFLAIAQKENYALIMGNERKVEQ